MVKDHSYNERAVLDQSSSVSHKKISHKEGNVLFNDALNTFYLRLYGVQGFLGR